MGPYNFTMRSNRSPLTIISWICYLVGALLVGGSYINLVPSGIAWIGWLVSMVGWGILTFSRRKQP